MAAPNGRGHRLTRRGPHSRGAREGSLYSVRSASVSASWLGSLAALSAATRTRAPKRATVNQKAAPSRGDFLRGSILTNATVHRTVAPGFDAPLGRAKAGVRFAPLYFIRSKKNKATQWVVLFFLERATGKAAQRRLRRMQQAAFKAAPRLADANVAARRLAQRGNHRSAACGR